MYTYLHTYVGMYVVCSLFLIYDQNDDATHWVARFNKGSLGPDPHDQGLRNLSSLLLFILSNNNDNQYNRSNNNNNKESNNRLSFEHKYNCSIWIKWKVFIAILRWIIIRRERLAK